MFEMWQFLIAMAIALLGVPTAGFALLALFEGFPKIRLGQIAGIVAVLAWVFALFTAGPWNEGPRLLPGRGGPRADLPRDWKREFRLLMLRGDDEFPGRWDRLGWFLVHRARPRLRALALPLLPQGPLARVQHRGAVDRRAVGTAAEVEPVGRGRGAPRRRRPGRVESTLAAEGREMVDDMFYPFAGIVAIIAGLISIPTVAFIILALFEGFPRIRLGQVAGIVAVVAWFFGLFGSPGPWHAEAYLFWTVVGLVLLFFGVWKREVGQLMSRRDDEFPGRSDSRLVPPAHARRAGRRLDLPVVPQGPLARNESGRPVGEAPGGRSRARGTTTRPTHPRRRGPGSSRMRPGAMSTPRSHPPESRPSNRCPRPTPRRCSSGRSARATPGRGGSSSSGTKGGCSRSSTAASATGPRARTSCRRPSSASSRACRTTTRSATWRRTSSRSPPTS